MQPCTSCNSNKDCAVGTPGPGGGRALAKGVVCWAAGQSCTPAPKFIQSCKDNSCYCGLNKQDAAKCKINCSTGEDCPTLKPGNQICVTAPANVSGWSSPPFWRDTATIIPGKPCTTADITKQNGVPCHQTYRPLCSDSSEMCETCHYNRVDKTVTPTWMPDGAKCDIPSKQYLSGMPACCGVSQMKTTDLTLRQTFCPCASSGKQDNTMCVWGPHLPGYNPHDGSQKGGCFASVAPSCDN
jgi:hypothetical protein